MYLQEALKTTGRTNKKPEPHHEFAYVRIVKSLPSKQGNGQRTQMSWFSTLLTPTPGILFFTRFPCASPEFLQHFAISNSGTSWTDCWGIDQKVSKLLSATQWKTFFFFFLIGSKKDQRINRAIAKEATGAHALCLLEEIFGSSKLVPENRLFRWIQDLT